MIATLVLTIVCQAMPGCELQIGEPLLGVVADGASSCAAVYLDGGRLEACDLLGGLVGLGDLYRFPEVAPGEAVALDFTEAP